jgi:transposase-like protein
MLGVLLGRRCSLMPNTKPPYPAEFKLEAVRLVKESGQKTSDIARDLGVTGESIRYWVRQHEIDTGEREGLSLNVKSYNVCAGRSGFLKMSGKS